MSIKSACRVYDHVAAKPDGISALEIALDLGLSQPSACNAVRDLVQAGLIVRFYRIANRRPYYRASGNLRTQAVQTAQLTERTAPLVRLILTIRKGTHEQAKRAD